MQSQFRNFILTTGIVLAIFCPALRADGYIGGSIKITGTYLYAPTPGVYVGPYSASLTPPALENLLVYCLDGNKNVTDTEGAFYPFADAVKLGSGGGGQNSYQVLEEEVAFLAAYSLYKDPAHNNIDTVEGPISTAIWDIMGTSEFTLSGVALQSEQYYKTLAENVVTKWNPGLFLPSGAFLSQVYVWVPTSGSGGQRFITAVKDDAFVQSAVPEPGTWVFMVSGVLLVALGLIRRRRQGA